MAAERAAADQRVLLLAPTSRDGEATRGILAAAGIACIVCPSLDHVCTESLNGAAAVIVPEEVVLADDSDRLAHDLRKQPVWSDLPVIVLSRAGAESPAVEKAMASFGNVSLVERPMRVSTLLSVVRAALRARERQYQVRDALEARRRDQERLARDAMVLSYVQDSVIVTDLDGTITFWNDGATRLFGFEASEMVGRPYADRLPEPSRTEVRDWIARIAAGEAEFQGEWLDHRKDGSAVWIEATTRRISDAAGKPVAIMGVSRDITGRKQAEAAVVESEAKFRHLAETLPQLAWMANADGWIFWYNRRWYEYTGTTPEQMQGWGWQSVHDPAELPRAMERWRHSIQTGEPFEMEFPLRAADGKFRWFLTRVAPFRDADGAIQLWFGTNTDIEDQRRIAEERAQLLDAERAARTEAERASQMKDEFLATLSHELRTPLNAILGWSQILARGPQDAEDLSEGLKTIERNARAQTQIIEDLLDMSRIISGKIRLDVQRIDLASVVHGAVETARPAAEAKNVRLQAVLDPLGSKVYGDPNRLQQVMWNLLSNAIKFTPKGGRVQVLLERVNSHVEVAVIDSGEGIQPEFLPHVFDRFRQADASTTRRHGGLGLGLAIVKQLVELHGGEVLVKSPGAGKGATFTVSLPLTVLHPDPEPEAPRRHPAAATANDGVPSDLCLSLAGVKILVVDDEADARMLVRRVLENCDAVVTTAGSVAEAIDLFHADPPDVLVSDVGMPDEDGYDLIRRVRALTPERGGDVPAVALTAYARSEDRMRSVLAGFQMHIAKPVEPAELTTMVASLAGRTPAG